MSSETLRIALGYIFAMFVIGSCMWFLYAALLDLHTAALPEDIRGIVVGGMFTLMGAAAQFVFGTTAASAAARQSERASAAGASAALSTPDPPKPKPEETSQPGG